MFFFLYCRIRTSSGEQEAGPIKSKFLRCEICPYVSTDKRLFYKHKKGHERQSKIQNGFQCGHCHFKANKAFIVKVHSNKYHQNRQLKILSIAEGKPVKVFYDNDIFGEDIPDSEVANNVVNNIDGQNGDAQDQSFPIAQVKGHAPMDVIRDLTENPQEAVPALPSSLNTLEAVLAKIPQDMVFKTPQKCPQPNCEYTNKVRYNLVRHLRSHQEFAQGNPPDGASPVATGGTTSSQVGNQDDMDMSSLSDSSSADEGNEPSAKRVKVTKDISLYAGKIPNKELYQCRSCVFMDKSASKVRKHFCLRHSILCPYACGYCSYVSVDERRIRKHSGKAHPDLEIKVIIRRDQVWAAGANARKSNAPQDQTTSSPKSYTKEKADGSGPFSEMSDEFELKLTSYIKPSDSDENLSMCKICSHEQDNASALKRHLLSVHLVFYPYKCKYCFFAAVELQKTIKHVERSHPGQPLLVKKRKFTGEWPVLPETGKVPFNEESFASAKQQVSNEKEQGTQIKEGSSIQKGSGTSAEPLSLKISEVTSHAETLSPNAPGIPSMPRLSPAPIMQHQQQSASTDQPQTLVSLLTHKKVDAAHGKQEMVG